MNLSQQKKQLHTHNFLDLGCQILGIDLTDAQRAKIFAHMHHLIRWNNRINLTAVEDPSDIVIRHILDSLVIYPHIVGHRLLDIGSGGGFPGLPLAIAHPALEIVLLDSRGKKAEFLRYVVGQLGLGHIRIVNKRIEDYQPSEKFDTLVARAFSPLPDLLYMTKSLLQPGTRLLAMKGKVPDAEINCLTGQWLSRLKLVKLSVPYLEAERHLVVIDI